ncbi:MAG: hypothetical protein AABZ60_11050 [Planctomycetota bacterium]
MLKEIEDLRKLERAGYSLQEQWSAISNSPQLLQQLGGDPRNIIYFDSSWKEKLNQLFSFKELDVLNYLQKNSSWVSPTEIAYEIGGYSTRGKRRNSSWASPICKQLVEKGLVDRNEHGHYKAKEHLKPSSLEHCRGFELILPLQINLSVGLIHADVYRVSLALSRILKNQGNFLSIKKLRNPQIAERIYGYLLQQYQGHPWSFFFTDSPSLGLIQVLSQELQSKGLYWYHSDYSGWAGYSLFSNGDLIERYEYGPKQNADTLNYLSGTTPFCYQLRQEEFERVYSFQSQLRSVSEEEIRNPEHFLRASFRFHDAYVPDPETLHYACIPGGYIPRGDYFQLAEEQTSFSSVYLLKKEDFLA